MVRPAFTCGLFVERCNRSRPSYEFTNRGGLEQSGLATNPHSAKLVGEERHMMNCGWLMMAGGLVASGVLVLAGAAFIKYPFFADRGTTAAG